MLIKISLQETGRFYYRMLLIGKMLSRTLTMHQKKTIQPFIIFERTNSLFFLTLFKLELKTSV